MDADEKTVVSVTIMAREYRVQCGADEVEALQAAAFYLHERMQEVQSAVGEGASRDRLVTMAALNVINDYLADGDEQVARLSQMREKIEKALPK